MVSDRKREIFFPSIFDKDRWREHSYSIFILKDKNDSEFKVVMKFLHKKYDFHQDDYKMYHPNIIRNNGHIEQCKKTS